MTMRVPEEEPGKGGRGKSGSHQGGQGKKMYPRRGTPQGGVISPLLANIYLNVLDTLWAVKKVQEKLGARLVRYADDCVIPCIGNTDRILKGIKMVFGNLGLTLSEEKTRISDARQEMFQFLGFSIGMKRGIKTGRMYTHIEPSKKALKHVRAEIKQLTTERYSATPTAVVIRDGLLPICFRRQSMTSWLQRF